MTTATTAPPFDTHAIGHYRYRFRDWVEEHFPYLARFPRGASPEELTHFCRNRDTLMDAVRAVLETVEQCSGPAIRGYYGNGGDLRRLQHFYDANDDAQFCFWVDELIGGITWE